MAVTNKINKKDMKDKERLIKIFQLTTEHIDDKPHTWLWSDKMTIGWKHSVDQRKVYADYGSGG